MKVTTISKKILILLFFFILEFIVVSAQVEVKPTSFDISGITDTVVPLEINITNNHNFTIYQIVFSGIENLTFEEIPLKKEFSKEL